MPSEKFAEASRAFRRRLGCVLAVREGLRFTFAWNMFWAGAVVALRGIWLVDRWLLLWGAAGLAASAVVAAVIAFRRLPAPGVIRAVLDRHAALGGLLMADGDVDIATWSSRIDRVPSPAIGWRFRRPMMLWAVSAAFVVAAFLMPDRALATSGNALQIGGDIHKLADQLHALAQEQLVPPEKAKILEKDLERLRKDAQGNDPAKTMEATDNLAQSFHKTAAEAAESAIRQTETLSREQRLANALKKAFNKATEAGKGADNKVSDAGKDAGSKTSGADKVSDSKTSESKKDADTKTSEPEKDPKKLDEAMKDLAKMTEQSAEENEALSQSLSKELKEACRKGELSEKQLEELSKDLAEAAESEEAKVARLADAQLLDADAVERCKAAEGAGEELDAAELDAALGKGQKGSLSDEGERAALLAGQGLGNDTSELKEPGAPGRGGLTRGYAPAAMTWKDAAKKDDAAFKAKALPIHSLKNSRLMRVSSDDPRESQPGGESSGGALNAAQAGGGEAHTQVILPEHEKTVERYFERGKK